MERRLLSDLDDSNNELYKKALKRSSVRGDGRRYLVVRGFVIDQFGVKHFFKRDIKFAVWVWNLYHPNDVCRPGFQVHHIDGNRLNDIPPNLKKLTTGQHSRIHMMGNQLNRGRRLSKAHKEKIAIANEGKILSSMHRRKISSTMKKRRKERGANWTKQ